MIIKNEVIYFADIRTGKSNKCGYGAGRVFGAPFKECDGCEMLGMEVREVAGICIEGMKEYAQELQLLGTENS